MTQPRLSLKLPRCPAITKPLAALDPNYVILDEAEQDWHEYEYEQWSERDGSYRPLITLEELRNRPHLDVDWYAPDFIPVGAKTIIAAEPKIGKTLLLLHILQKVVTGGEWLGQQCTQERVIYLTEQTEHEFRMQVEEVPNLIGNPNFYVLLAEDQPPACITWQGTLEWIQKMVTLTKAKIVVLDTFGSLAKLPPMGENDSSTIQNYINQMSFLFKQRYLSVVLTHHNRKKSNDGSKNQSLDISAIRGSSAFAGGGGHVITMDAPNATSCKRRLNINGRYLKKDLALELNTTTGVYSPISEI